MSTIPRRIRHIISLSTPLLTRTPTSTPTSHLSSSFPHPHPNPQTTPTNTLLSLFPIHHRSLHTTTPLSLPPRFDRDAAGKTIDDNEPLFEGCDYHHWLIVMDFPKDNPPPREQMIETYVHTAAQVLGSVEEAKKKIYACSTTTYTGFQVDVDEDTSKKFEGLPGVIFVLPDSYIDPVNKEYGGDKYINGEIIPRPPPYTYGRQRQTEPRTPRGGVRNNMLPQHDGPQQNHGPPRHPPPQQNYGPPRHPPPQQNYGPPRHPPPQQNYGQQGPTHGDRMNYSPSSNYPPQQNYSQQGSSGQQGPMNGDGRNYSSSSTNYPPQHNYAPNQPHGYQNYGPNQSHQNHGPNQSHQGYGQPQNYSPQHHYSPAGQGDRTSNPNYPVSGGQHQGPVPPSQGTYNQSNVYGQQRAYPPENQGVQEMQRSFSGGNQAYSPTPPSTGTRGLGGAGQFGPSAGVEYGQRVGSGYGPDYRPPEVTQGFANQAVEQGVSQQVEQRNYPPQGQPGMN